MEYILHLLIFIAFYTMLAQSLNLAAGMTGLISLSHAAFYGIGAYTTAILSLQFGFSFWLNLPLAMLFSGLIAFVVSLIALRTVEDYFIICTLGIQVIIFSVMNNWMDVTRGPLGLPGIPSINIFGFALDYKIFFLLLCVFFACLGWFVLKNIAVSGFGKVLRAIKEDEIYTQSIGKNVYKSKIISFTLSAVLAAIPGALYAHYISYIDPTSFTVNESIFILSIVIIGGMVNFRGDFVAKFLVLFSKALRLLFIPDGKTTKMRQIIEGFGVFEGGFVAATFLVLLPESLRFLGMPDSIAANMRQIIYGLILVIVMMRGKKL